MNTEKTADGAWVRTASKVLNNTHPHAITLVARAAQLCSMHDAYCDATAASSSKAMLLQTECLAAYHGYATTPETLHPYNR
jgi:hypothetical protein